MAGLWRQMLDKLLGKWYVEKDYGKFLGGNMYRVYKPVWI